MLFGNSTKYKEQMKEYKEQMKEYKERHNRNKPNSYLANKKTYFSSKIIFHPFSYLLERIQKFYNNNKTTIEKFFTIDNTPTHHTVNTRLETNEANATRDFKQQMERYLDTKFAIDENESYYGIYTEHAEKLTHKSKISEGVIKTLVVLHSFDGFKSFNNSTNEFYKAIFDYKKESIIATNYNPISDHKKEHRLHGNYDKSIVSDWTRLIVKDIFDPEKYFNSTRMNGENENYYKNKTFYIQETGDLKKPQVFYDHIMTPKLIQIKDIEKVQIPKQENSMSASSKERINYKINNDDNIIVPPTEKVYIKKGSAGGKRTQKHKRRSKKRKTSRKTRRKHY
jgi:hypothetical protein